MTVRPQLLSDALRNPARGPVAMYCLIAAETAIFTIFVVAYIFYIGKSVSGPQPGEVLRLPLFATICLLSSSVTIHVAVKCLRTARVVSFSLVVGSDVRAGSDLPDVHLSPVASPDL